jgi:hypothetical protein
VELEKVRYLAFDCDWECAEEFEFENEHEYLAMVLSYFPNVEKVTINRIGPFHAPAESGNLVFLQTPSVDVMLYGGPDNAEDRDLFNCCRALVKWPDFNLFDWEEVNDYRRRRMARTGNFAESEELPPLPQIDWQFITTPGVEAKFQELVRLEAIKYEERERREEERERKREERRKKWQIQGELGKDRYNLRSENATRTGSVGNRGSRRVMQYSERDTVGGYSGRDTVRRIQ